MSTSSRLFIGNLPYDLTTDELNVILDENGHRATHTKIVLDRETGRGRGFGFVDFGTEQHAQAAMAQLNGLMVRGRPLRVDRATEPTRTPSTSRAPAAPRMHDDWGNAPSSEGRDRDRGGRGMNKRDRGSRW